MNWQKHYNSMNIEVEEEPVFYWGNVPVKKKSKKVKLSDIRKLALSFARQEKRLRQAKDIRKVEPKKINTKSVSSLIFQVLSASSPMHIVDIITKLEGLGWKSNSIYHKYSNVQHALSNNYYMFERVSIGTYQIRKAFTADNKEITVRTQRKPIDLSLKIATMKDIVANVVGYYADHNNLTASDIHYIVFNTGVNCSYSAVRRALQDKRFKKENKWYTLK